MKLNEYFNKLWGADYPAPPQKEAEASFERFANKAFNKRPATVFSIKRYWKPLSAAVAAIVLFAVVLQLVISPAAEPDFLLVENTGETIRAFTLPDHSVVNLLPGATLQYGENSEQGRTVKLEGEAYFEVTKNEHQPFTVVCNRTTTTVLGTSFNVRSLVNSGTEVVLYEGSVKLEVAGTAQDWVLSPGELFVYRDAKTEVQPFRTQEADAQLYVDFEKASLSDIAAYIQKVYGYTVTGDSGILAERMTMRVRKNEPLDNIMKTITSVYDLGYHTDTQRREINLTQEQ